MISVEEALKIVLDHPYNGKVISLPLHQSIGRILAENIFADRPFPPFDRVCMDGIAINYNQYEKGQRFFEVEKIGAAGMPQQHLEDTTKCIEIMTGAPLPLNTNTIIRYEDLKASANGFEIMEIITPLKNLHFKGSDHQQGEIVLFENQKIKAIDVNVLATVGKSEVVVKANPKVAVISSGEELIPIEAEPLAHQIRRSNVHMLIASLNQIGLVADNFHLKDEEEDIFQQLKKILETYDVLLLSGGVSKGKFDFIPKVLDQLEVNQLFHRVKQRPGKPFWFGHKEQTFVFAFPGNPVSTLACFHKYFIPWWQKSQFGKLQETIFVQLEESVTFNPNLTYFAQAKISFDSLGGIIAKVNKGNGSGDMINPTKQDGFIEFPSHKNEFKKGTVYPFLPFHPLF